jgi:beta-glucuronidase
MADVCGWNIYPRWYDDRSPGDCVAELIAGHTPNGMANKPLIISEFGAGALPGYCGMHNSEKKNLACTAHS